MALPIISGIQQMGIGVPNVKQSFDWYRNNFGFDIPVFEEAAEAALMKNYTGGEVHKRHAILSINIQGGGGLEIWQFTSRTPQAAEFDLQLGDLGIYAAKIKCLDIETSFRNLKAKNPSCILTDISERPNGTLHFFVRDENGNLFECVDGSEWLYEKYHDTGGIKGAIIGVSNIEKALPVYQTILGYEKVVYDKEGIFDDLKGIPGADRRMRRVLLKAKSSPTGSFSKLYGPTEIELVSLSETQGRKIFKDRYWGDLGFIHLCFEVRGMKEMKERCAALNFPFTVDSDESFDMGEAAGQFSYIEDPDGTLIEFVETHKIPILKKIGWYHDLRNKAPEANVPNWMIKAMRFSRVK